MYTKLKYLRCFNNVLKSGHKCLDSLNNVLFFSFDHFIFNNNYGILRDGQSVIRLCVVGIKADVTVG